jgi:hypothetical protein
VRTLVRKYGPERKKTTDQPSAPTTARGSPETPQEPSSQPTD